MLDQLELDDAHATAIVERGIEYEVYEGDKVPSNKKDRMEAAHDLVTFAIDAWTNDDVTPDSDDEETAEAGKQVQDILEWAGIEIDGDGDVEFGSLPDIEGDDGEEEEDGDGDDETAFDANDIIEGYDDAGWKDIIAIFEGGELTADEIRAIQDYEKENGERAKIINFEVEEEEGEEGGEEAGEEPWEGYDSATAKDITDGLKALDEDSELDSEFAEYVKSYEENRETPKKRVITFLEKWLEANGGESGSEDDDGDDNEGDESEEPFEGFDGASVKQIKDAITEAAEAEELDADDVAAIIAYEEGNKNRAGLVKWLNELTEEDDEEGSEDEEGEEEEAEEPAPKKGKRSGKKKSSGDIDLDEDEVEAMLPTPLAQLHIRSKLDYAEAQIEEQGLKLTGAYEGDMPELPNDISGYSHADMSDLLAQFQNAHSTASAQASQATIMGNTYGELAEYVEDLAILESDQSNAEKRKAEARTDGTVVFFRAKAADYRNQSRRWTDLAGELRGKTAVVSRVGGFVEGDGAQSDLRAAKPSTRGAAKGSVAKKATTTKAKPSVGRKAAPAAKASVKKPAAKAKPTVKRR